MKALILVSLCMFPVVAISQSKMKITEKAWVFSNADPLSKSLIQLKPGDSVLLLGHTTNSYFRIKIDTIQGYVHESKVQNLLSDDEMSALNNAGASDETNANTARAKRVQESYDRDVKALDSSNKADFDQYKNDRLGWLTKRYGKDDAVRAYVYKGVWIGMPSALIYEAKGLPEKSVKTRDASGERELWKYPKQDLYIVDHKLYSITDY